MHDLVDKGEMEADVAMSVQQLYELMAMPEWEKDQAGDTRGYAFLMLAEGAIHGILRSAQARGTGSGEDPSARPPVPIRTSWRGTYNNSFPIQLNLATWSGSRFDGTMTYPDGDTVTSVTGTVEADADGARLTWKEQEYTRPGRRTIDFGGNYAATIRGDTMDGAWYQGTRRVASFTMTASSTSPTTSFPN